MIVCIELRNVTEILYAYHRLLDANEKHVDLAVSDTSQLYLPDFEAS
jgi:hypothetical protein